VNANINIGLVPDGGQPLGTNGAPEGDPRFGDIRIAAFPLSTNAVAEASPFNVMSGTSSGDVDINPAYFGAGSNYDLFTVMLHEAGHVIGLPDNTDPTSVMDEVYAGPRSGLSATDIVNLQALYGVRQPDANDASSPNKSLATAVRLTPGNATVNGDLSTLQDVDYYQFKAAANSVTTVLLQTSGISLLVPQLTVYDASGNVVQSVVSNGPLGGDLSVRLNNLTPGSTYYIEVQGATSDVFGIGSYRLSVATGTGTSSATSAWPYATAPTTANASSTVCPTVNLQAQIYRSSGLFSYTVQGTLADPTQVQNYRFKTPNTSNTATVMTLMAWTRPLGGATPVLTIYDKSGAVVASNVLVNDSGTYSVQIPAAATNTFYTVSVATQPSPTGQSAGNYFLAIDFGEPVESIQNFVNGAILTLDQPLNVGALTVSQSQLVHFALSVPTGAPQGSLLQWTVYDPLGHVVLTAFVTPGSTITRNLYMAPGTYQMTFALVGATTNGPLSFSFGALTLSDPIGPQSVDPTLDPGTTIIGGLVWWNGYYGSLLFLASP
jgi:hypothetical protein